VRIGSDDISPEACFLPQRDYILRLIEQMGVVLAALRKRILGRKDDPSAIAGELAGVAGRAGFDLEVLRGFSADTLHMLVAPTGEVEPARCWMMAEVLYLDGLQAGVEERHAEARDGLEKARVLFTLLEPGGGMLLGFAEAANRIQEIDARLKALPAP
jgi:hypothetical protein